MGASQRRTWLDLPGYRREREHGFGTTVTRPLGVMYLVGSAISLATALAASNLSKAAEIGLLAITASGLVTGLVLVTRRGRMPRWFGPAISPWSSLHVGAAAALTGGAASPVAVIYLWLALNCGYYLHRTHARIQVSFSLATFAVALLVGQNGPHPIGTWVAYAATMFLAVEFMHGQKQRIRRLIARLTVVAGCRSSPARPGITEEFEWPGSTLPASSPT